MAMLPIAHVHPLDARTYRKITGILVFSYFFRHRVEIVAQCKQIPTDKGRIKDLPPAFTKNQQSFACILTEQIAGAFIRSVSLDLKKGLYLRQMDLDC